MKAQNWTNYEDRLNRVTAYVYNHLDEDFICKRWRTLLRCHPITGTGSITQSGGGHCFHSQALAAAARRRSGTNG
jgi:hypothetical protein